MRAHTLADALTKGSGTERSFLCPVHGDSHPSASVNVLKKAWICYTCGAYGYLTGEDLLGEIHFDALRGKVRALAAPPQVRPEAWLNTYDAGEVHPYWLGRFRESTARRHRLGFDHASGAATYPLRDRRGRVLGVVRRNLLGEGAKYKYPFGIDISRLLFGYQAGVSARVVVLTEGAVDAVALDEAGVPDVLGIYGARLSRDQAQLIRALEPQLVVTAFDRDDAGWAAHLRARGLLSGLAVERMTWPRWWGKDPAELTIEQRGLAYSEVTCIESLTCESRSRQSPGRSKDPSRSTTSASTLSPTPSAGLSRSSTSPSSTTRTTWPRPRSGMPTQLFSTPSVP